MAKKKTKKPTTFVTASLGLFYLRIERDGVESDVIGPFKTLSEAEEEQANKRSSARKTDVFKATQSAVSRLHKRPEEA